MIDITITDTQYINDPITGEVESVRATINERELYVPLDPANRHYAEIMRQVEAGELTIADADPVPEAEE